MRNSDAIKLPLKEDLENFSLIIKDVTACLNNWHGIRRSERYWSIILAKDICRILSEMKCATGRIATSQRTGELDSNKRITQEGRYSREKNGRFWDAARAVRRRLSVRSWLFRKPWCCYPEVALIPAKHFSRLTYSRLILSPDFAVIVPEFQRTDEQCLLNAIERDREELIKLMPNDSRLRELKTRILRELPSEYLSQSFPALARQLVEKYPRCKRIVVHYFSTIQSRIWAAEMVEQGSLLIGVQHGGYYGEAKHSLIHEVEIALCDKFVTWGWGNDHGRLISLPAPKLERTLPSIFNIAQRKNILFLMPPLREENVVDNLALRQFLNSLLLRIDGELHSRVLIRPHPKGSFGALEEVLGGNTWCIDSESSFKCAMSRSSLMVNFSPFSTTFLQGVINDIPSICIASGLKDLCSDRSVSEVNALLNCGVFVEIGDPAALPLLTEAMTSQNWWGDQERTEAVRNYMQKFGLSSNHSGTYSSWRKFLEEVRE